jgi:hypothetical protein
VSTSREERPATLIYIDNSKGATKSPKEMNAVNNKGQLTELRRLPE